MLGFVGLLVTIFGGWRLEDALREQIRVLDRVDIAVQNLTKAQVEATVPELPTEEPRPSRNFGNNDGPFADDDQCDDSRFTGPEEYVFSWAYGEHDGTDAADCERLVSQGLIQWKE